MGHSGTVAIAGLIGALWAALPWIDARAAEAAAASETAVPSGETGAMVVFPGGRTRIGNNRGPAEERPAFETIVSSFALDRSPVTVEAFAAFVAATGHETDAERFGNAGVMDFGTGRWRLVSGATWKHPQGPQHAPAPADHPVTQVSWQDAQAYCRWQDKRLPTEIEWEFAARHGQPDNPRYAFGDAYVQDGDYLANVWTGIFPVVNNANDGFLYTSPVGHYGLTPQGLTDMAGNVWEWTDSWYLPYAKGTGPARPATERVQRGGSFLCDPKICHGFRVSARSHSTPDTSLMHVGFRCARDAGAPPDQN